jgi:CRP-like cAMP-binding protein
MASVLPPQLPVDEATAQAVFKAFQLEGFFPEFSAELCSKVFPRSGVHQFPPSAVLIEQGERGRDLFLVLGGAVSVSRAPGKVDARVGPGTVLGEIALLADGVRTATASADAPTVVYRLAYEDVGYLLKNNPALAEHLKTLARERTGK